MKNVTRWTGVVAAGLVSVAAFGGCASSPDGGAATIPGTAGTGAGGSTAGTGTGGTATGGTAGTGTGGAAGGTAGTLGMAGGTHIKGTGAYVVLSGADAAPGATPAPAAYAASSCSTCHGDAGEGKKFLAPEIRHTPTDYSTWVVRHGRIADGMQSGMVAFPLTTTDPVKNPAISDADLMAVQTWLQGLPRPTTGQALYLDFCGNCHGPVTPTGGAATVSILGKTVADVDMKVRMGNGLDQTMRDMFMPKFSMTDVTEAELTLIKGFIGAQ